MYRLIIFNLRKIFVCIGTYLIPFIGILMFAALTLPVLLNNETKKTLIFKQSLFTYAVLFIISLTFIAYIVIHFFKNPNKDGSSLIIMAKRISRNKYIASNMLSTIIMVFYFSIFITIGSLVVISFDHYSTFIQKIKFSGSIFIASIIIMAIFASVIILYSIFSNERLIMVLTILTAVMLPLISFTVKPLFDKPFTFGDNYLASKINKDNETNEKGIALDMTDYDGAQKNNFQKYQTSKYKNVVWLDAWYQVSGLYTTFFQKDNQANKIWEKSTTTFNISKQDLTVNLEVNNKVNNYALLTVSAQIDPVEATRVSELSDIYISKVKTILNGLSPTLKSKYLNLNFEQQLSFSSVVLDNVTTGDVEIQIKKELKGPPKEQFSSSNLYIIQTYEKLINHNIINPSIKTSINPKDFFSNQGLKNHILLIPNNTQLKVFITKNYIDAQWLILLWVGIIIVTNIGTYYIFTKLKFS